MQSHVSDQTEKSTLVGIQSSWLLFWKDHMGSVHSRFLQEFCSPVPRNG
jgi:hypothetical protein